MQKGEPTWEELRQFGAGWWIDNINILKRTMEKVGGKRCQPTAMFFNTKQLNYTVNLEIFTVIYFCEFESKSYRLFFTF